VIVSSGGMVPVIRIVSLRFRISTSISGRFANVEGRDGERLQLLHSGDTQSVGSKEGYANHSCPARLRPRKGCRRD